MVTQLRSIGGFAIVDFGTFPIAANINFWREAQILVFVEYLDPSQTFYVNTLVKFEYYSNNRNFTCKAAKITLLLKIYEAYVLILVWMIYE